MPVTVTPLDAEIFTIGNLNFNDSRHPEITVSAVLTELTVDMGHGRILESARVTFRRHLSRSHSVLGGWALEYASTRCEDRAELTDRMQTKLVDAARGAVVAVHGNGADLPAGALTDAVERDVERKRINEADRHEREMVNIERAHAKAIESLGL